MEREKEKYQEDYKGFIFNKSLIFKTYFFLYHGPFCYCGNSYNSPCQHMPIILIKSYSYFKIFIVFYIRRKLIIGRPLFSKLGKVAGYSILSLNASKF